MVSSQQNKGDRPSTSPEGGAGVSREDAAAPYKGESQILQTWAEGVAASPDFNWKASVVTLNREMGEVHGELKTIRKLGYFDVVGRVAEVAALVIIITQLL